MKRYVLGLLVLFSGVANAVNLHFMWDSPADPSLVNETRLYESGSPEPIGVAAMPDTELVVDGDAVGVVTGSHCFFATHANDDAESNPSNELCITIPPTPLGLIVEIKIAVDLVN